MFRPVTPKPSFRHPALRIPFSRFAEPAYHEKGEILIFGFLSSLFPAVELSLQWWAKQGQLEIPLGETTSLLALSEQPSPLQVGLQWHLLCLQRRGL